MTFILSVHHNHPANEMLSTRRGWKLRAGNLTSPRVHTLLVHLSTHLALLDCKDGRTGFSLPHHVVLMLLVSLQGSHHLRTLVPSYTMGIMTSALPASSWEPGSKCSGVERPARRAWYYRYTRTVLMHWPRSCKEMWESLSNVLWYL